MADTGRDVAGPGRDGAGLMCGGAPGPALDGLGTALRQVDARLGSARARPGAVATALGLAHARNDPRRATAGLVRSGLPLTRTRTVLGTRTGTAPGRTHAALGHPLLGDGALSRDHASRGGQSALPGAACDLVTESLKAALRGARGLSGLGRRGPPGQFRAPLPSRTRALPMTRAPPSVPDPWPIPARVGVPIPFPSSTAVGPPVPLRTPAPAGDPRPLTPGPPVPLPATVPLRTPAGALTARDPCPFTLGPPVPLPAPTPRRADPRVPRPRRSLAPSFSVDVSSAVSAWR